MSNTPKTMTGEQLLLARVLGRLDSRTIAAELDHRAMMGADDQGEDVLQSIRPLRRRRSEAKAAPALTTAA